MSRRRQIVLSSRIFSRCEFGLLPYVSVFNLSVYFFFKDNFTSDCFKESTKTTKAQRSKIT